MKKHFHSGSALLLAIMVISVLTTTTLGAIAIRFDQLISTDRITSASKAKLAADSGLIKLREKLGKSETAFDPEAYDITSEESVQIPRQGRFRPNPRNSVYSLESQVINLPRCLAVAVLSPWVNTGSYLLDNDDSQANPALLFYYANIINDTPLGTIRTIAGGSYSDQEKERSLSELTKMGQFYNPYAPSGYRESNRNYWTVKLGGPQDQFLYKKDSTGTSSFYKNLDFLYIPYLPRFTDSGVLKVANEPNSGLVRKDATTIRNDFENVIKNNNLKVWLDASVTNDLLYQYGLADLFTDGGDDENSRITWLQPSLWNDLPEADTETGYASGLSGPYLLEDTNTVTTGMQWQRKATPIKNLGNSDSTNWTAEISRGSKSLSFVYPSGDLSRAISPSANISFNFFGSLEGIRLNQPITVTAIEKSTGKPINLQERDSTSQGKFYNVKVKNIIKLGNGEITIQLSFSQSSYQTPSRIGGSTHVKLSEISVVGLQAGPQYATKRSISGATLKVDGRTVTIPASGCDYSEANFVVCPAVGDIVSLNKPDNEPVWGKVTNVTFNGDGTQLLGFELDKFREMPLPTRDLASSVVTVGADEKIAYYGGTITATEFDGGVNSISDGLWLYDPNVANQNDAWTYMPNNGPEVPGPRSGAGLAAVNGELFLFGGHRYEGVGQIGPGKLCADNYHLMTCLGSNRPGARVAKVFPTTMFSYNIQQRTWTKRNYHASNISQPSLQNNTQLELKIVSRFSDRSGKDNWQTRVSVNTNTNLQITPGIETTLSLTSSNAGIAVGDEMYINGTKDNSPFLTWGRIVSLPTPSSVGVKVYGIKDASGAVTLSSASITILNRVKGSAKCFWQELSKSCLIEGRVDGIGLGDAVVLEQYNDYQSPTQLLATYSGYVSSVNSNNRLVEFNSFDTSPTFDDYQTGTGIGGESVRLLPVGRTGGKLGAGGVDNNKLYYWQGDQPQSSVNARTVDIWEFDTTNNKWTPVQLDMGTLLAGDITVQSIRMPGQATVFTDSNNPELIKDKEISWFNNGIEQREKVWDDAKTWQLKISNESNQTSWNLERMAEGATLIIERQNGNFRERFTGIVRAIDTNDEANITVVHHPSFGGDSGIIGNSSNAKVTISYPNYSNSSSVYVEEASRDGVAKVKVTAAGSAVQLRKVPIGATILAYSGSLSGTNDRMMVSTVAERTIGLNSVVLKAAGPAFMTTPLQQIQSTSALIDNDTSMALSYQNFRLVRTEGAMEWVNNITGNKKWVGRFPNAYMYNGGPNRPPLRQNGTLAVSPNGENAFIAGGGFGPYTNVWKLGNAHRTALPHPSWTLGKSSASANADIPNLYGSTAEVTSGGKMVMFGGQRRFTNTTLGPKVLGQPNSSNNNDGTVSIADGGASLNVKSAQFTNQLKDQYSGVAKESLGFTSGVTQADFANVCRYVGQENCRYQLMRHLGTLGRFGSSWGNSLAVINPGPGFKKDSGARSLILSGPTQSLDRTNGRWDQEGYTPYKCDNNEQGCFSLPFGSLGQSENNNSKTIMFAGYSRITNGGSILVTPAGIGRAITTGPAGSSYCARDSINKNQNQDLDYYACKSNSLQARYMKWIPDSEDILFMFNAAKALSSTDAYRVVGYYGGVVRGYLAVSVGSELNVQEIAP